MGKNKTGRAICKKIAKLFGDEVYHFKASNKRRILEFSILKIKICGKSFKCSKIAIYNSSIDWLEICLELYFMNVYRIATH